jgi:hypothetical protein
MNKYNQHKDLVDDGFLRAIGANDMNEKAIGFLEGSLALPGLEYHKPTSVHFRELADIVKEEGIFEAVAFDLSSAVWRNLYRGVMAVDLGFKVYESILDLIEKNKPSNKKRL